MIITLNSESDSGYRQRIELEGQVPLFTDLPEDLGGALSAQVFWQIGEQRYLAFQFDALAITAVGFAVQGNDHGGPPGL